MGLRDALIDVPLTGDCKVDVDAVAKRFGMSTIGRWHDTYKFYNRTLGIKVQIPKEDALSIIQKAKLVEVPCPLFKNASTFMRPERWGRLLAEEGKKPDGN